MGNVKVIAANPTKAHSLKGIIKKILRVCAYCRVSTGTEEQKTSYYFPCLVRVDSNFITNNFLRGVRL